MFSSQKSVTKRRQRLQREIANVTGLDIHHIRATTAIPSSQQELQPESTREFDRAIPSTVDGADDHAPERPQSAYVIFSNNVRHDLKSENLTFTEIAKRVGEKWQTLSPEEREPFEAEAGSAKEAYLAELAKYKKTDQYREHARYLADFKAKHSSEADIKKPRLEPRPNPGRKDSVESQTDSPEPPLNDSVRHTFDHPSSKAVSHPRHPSSRSTTEATLPNVLSPSSPKTRYSPTTSVSSLTPSARTEKSSSPSVQPTPRQVAFPIASRERDPTKRPEPLPPITSLESRDPPLPRGSSFWFDNHLGSTPNNTSPLSNYRRSYHPPASFVHQNSTSTSQSTDLSEASNISTNPSEDSIAHGRPPTLTRDLKGPNPTVPADGLKPHCSVPLVAQTLLIKRNYKAPPHHEPSLSSLSLKVGIASAARQSTRSSSCTPVGSHRASPSVETYAKPDERKGIGLRGSLGSDADPLSILMYAGRVVEGRAQALD
ncbi:MAG: hypothetical protein Q9186_005816 [Xanthomendoza sp. 1 TL-2023]